MPTLRYPALLRAALAADPTARKPRPSDGYDIEHLTLGLSRCDIVTADRSMARITRERASSPTAASCSSAVTSTGLTGAIEYALQS